MSDTTSVEDLTRFLREDPVVAQALGTAAATAGVGRATDDLLVVGAEDVARLTHLELSSLSELRVAFQRLEPVIAGVFAKWREDSDSALTPQELLWVLTYVVAADGDEPAERIRGLVANEQWWQRITEGHQNRFLDRIVSQVAASVAPPDTG